MCNVSKYYTVFINGEPFNCSIHMSLQSLLTYLDVNIDHVIIEYNKQVVTCQQFSNLFLSNSDEIEIITIVGGG